MKNVTRNVTSINDFTHFQLDNHINNSTMVLVTYLHTFNIYTEHYSTQTILKIQILYLRLRVDGVVAVQFQIQQLD